MNSYCKCACLAALVVTLQPVAVAAPDYFSVSPASGKYSRALALTARTADFRAAVLRDGVVDD